MSEKLNIKESLKVLEQSRVLNPDMKMASIMDAVKKMEGVEGDISKQGWSALIYTNFILASGLPDELAKDPVIKNPVLKGPIDIKK